MSLAAEIDVTRSQWGGGARPRPLTPATHRRAELHHTGVLRHASMDPLEVAREIEAYHLSLGWNGAFYGLMPARDGRIIELRGIGWRSIGSHRPTYNDGTPVDRDALCVVLPGDYRHVFLTEPQVAALRRIRRHLPDRRIRDHGERDNTACPGTHATYARNLLNLDTGDDDMTPAQDEMLKAVHQALVKGFPGPGPHGTHNHGYVIQRLGGKVGTIDTIAARVNALTGKVDGIADSLTGSTPDDVIAYLETHLAALADQIAAIETGDGGSGSDLTPEQLVQLFADALLAGIGGRES